MIQSEPQPVTCHAQWPTGPVRLEWLPESSTNLPITGSHGFCFTESNVVVCNIVGRGLCIPGGHIEEDESPADCLVREALEEASIELTDLELLGYVIADHTINPSYRGKYPRRAAQAMFCASVTRMHEFAPRPDSDERRLVRFSELPSLHSGWNEVLEAARVCAASRRSQLRL